MDNYSQKEVSGAPDTGEFAKIDKFGDIVCPHCAARLITPPWARVTAGVGRCTLCNRVFNVSAQECAERK